MSRKPSHGWREHLEAWHARKIYLLKFNMSPGFLLKINMYPGFLLMLNIKPDRLLKLNIETAILSVKVYWSCASGLWLCTRMPQLR